MFLNNTFANDKPKFFGRRKGRTIRKAKSTLLESFLPSIKINENTELKAETLFKREVKEICLEIGFGNGEHLAGQALRHPENGYIGAEVFQNGVANLLTLITGIKEGSNIPETISLLPERVDNIRIYDDDIRLLFKRMPKATCGNDWKREPQDWVQTKYQRKALKEGRRPVFLDYKRK